MTTEDTVAQVYEHLKRVATSESEVSAVPMMSVRRYVGSLDSDGLFHGEGVLFSAMGFSYRGNFVHGKMEGYGRISWNSGTTYKGEFHENAPNGKGVFIWANGDRYVGEVQYGVRHGSGEFFTEHGVYNGAWKTGKRHGFGRQTYTSGFFYVGEWADDKRDGRGQLVYPGGDTYDGMWKNGKRHGFGVMGWKSGTPHYLEVYEGQWSCGVPHGRGRSTYVVHLEPNNVPEDIDSPANFSPTTCSIVNVYEGNYEQGERHGFGVFFYADGGTYEGEWRHGNKEGPGTCTTSAGASFHGTFLGNEAEELMKKIEKTGALPAIAVAAFFSVSDVVFDDVISTTRLLLLKYNLTLKSLFDDYSRNNKDVSFISTPPNWWRHRAPGQISFQQYLRLLSDAHVINGRICLSDVIDCVVATIKDEAKLNAKKGDMLKSERLNTLCCSILRLDGFINYRQFVESLMRLSVIACVGFNITEFSQRFAAFVEGYLAKERLTDEPLCPLTRKNETLLAPHLSLLEALFCKLATKALHQESDVSAVLPLRSFIIFVYGLFDEHGVCLNDAVNWLFPFDRFKTPGVVPTAVCQPRNALGFCMYQKSCGLGEEYVASLVASERRLTFVEFVEAVLGSISLIGATTEESIQEKLQDFFLRFDALATLNV